MATSWMDGLSYSAVHRNVNVTQAILELLNVYSAVWNKTGWASDVSALGCNFKSLRPIVH